MIPARKLFHQFHANSIHLKLQEGDGLAALPESNPGEAWPRPYAPPGPLGRSQRCGRCLDRPGLVLSISIADCLPFRPLGVSADEPDQPFITAPANPGEAWPRPYARRCRGQAMPGPRSSYASTCARSLNFNWRQPSGYAARGFGLRSRRTFDTSPTKAGEAWPRPYTLSL